MERDSGADFLKTRQQPHVIFLDTLVKIINQFWDIVTQLAKKVVDMTSLIGSERNKLPHLYSQFSLKLRTFCFRDKGGGCKSMEGFWVPL